MLLTKLNQTKKVLFFYFLLKSYCGYVIIIFKCKKGGRIIKNSVGKDKKKFQLFLIPVYLLIFLAVLGTSIILSIDVRYRLKEKKANNAENEQSDVYYYYNQLTYKEQLLFKEIKNAADFYEDKTEIVSYRYSSGEFQRIAKAIAFDCPELFYLDVDSLKLFCDKYKSSVTIEYLATPTAIKNMKMEMEAVSAAAVAYTNSEQTDFEKAVALHDFLTSHCTYAGKIEDGNSISQLTHKAYGALIQKYAFCDGYASAYKILLNRCGIECIIIEGSAQAEPHLWNMVKQGDRYYHIDCTWDDPDIDFVSDLRFHGFFNLSDREISKTHNVYDGFILPEAKTENNYYAQKNAVVSSVEEVEEVAYNQIKSAVALNQKYFELYIEFSNIESSYKEGLLKALDRINGEYDKAILSRSYRIFNATNDGNAVTVQIYYLNQE